MIVGILGGIGAGKTTVANMFAELGARTIEADRLAHAVLDSPSVRRKVVAWLGEEVLRPGGGIDRTAVARRVFRDPQSVRRIEELVHPGVLDSLQREIEHHKQCRQERPLVLDVPLLLGSRLQPLCDAFVYVDAPCELRAERAERKGWKPGELERRESFQPEEAEKKRLADFVIANTGRLDDTRRQVAECYDNLKPLARKNDGKSGAPEKFRERPASSVRLRKEKRDVRKGK